MIVKRPGALGDATIPVIVPPGGRGRSVRSVERLMSWMSAD
jgi:hypothetical protein